MADFLIVKEDFAGAEMLLRRALSIQEKMQRPDHPELVATYATLFSLLYKRRDFAAAEVLCRELLTMRERALGSDDLSVAESMTDLAIVRLAMGDKAAAQSLLMQAQRIHKGTSPEARSSIVALYDLAILLAQEGDCNGANRWYRRWLAADARSFGPKRSITERLRSNIEPFINRCNSSQRSENK